MVSVCFFPAYFGIASENTHTHKLNIWKIADAVKEEKRSNGTKKKTNSRSACRDGRVRAAYNRGKPSCVCVCVYFSSFCLSPFKVGNIFTTHTHTRAAVTKGRLCIYELLFFSFSLSLPFLSFLKEIRWAALVNIPRGCGVGVLVKKKIYNKRIIIIITRKSVTIVFLFASCGYYNDR